MLHADTHHTDTMKTWDQSQGSEHETDNRQNGTEAGFSLSTSVHSLPIIIPPMLHAPLSCDMFILFCFLFNSAVSS
jgi:hypothetical protein